MRADPQPADLSRREAARPPLPERGVGRDPLLPFLDAVRQGLLMIDPTGTVIAANAPARQLLAGLNVTLRVQASAIPLLRALRAGTAPPRGALLRSLRRALARRQPVVFELRHRDHTVQVELHPLATGGWVVSLEDVSIRKATEARADAMARRDPLTGLPNRLLLRERLAEALARLARTGECCALLLIDLDRFKPVNDTLGHPIGDALLETVADRLRSTVRPTDTVARIGGDEFVILQAGIRDAAGTQALARRVVDLIGRTYMVEGHLLTIGASVGVALAPEDGTDADRLLKNADLALYRAKLDGRGTYRFFEPEMDARMQARRKLELDLRQALARREFQLHFQPQLQLASGTLIGCEALIRWRHPERGLVSPSTSSRSPRRSASSSRSASGSFARPAATP